MLLTQQPCSGVCRGTCVCAHVLRKKWQRWTGVWVWGVPGSFIWISRGRMTHGDKWVSCARTERRRSGSPSPFSLTTLWGLCLCVCNRGPGVGTWASGGRRVRVPVCSSICVPVTVHPCRPRRKKHSCLWQVSGFSVFAGSCVTGLRESWAESLGRILALPWNQRTSELERPWKYVGPRTSF